MSQNKWEKCGMFSLSFFFLLFSFFFLSGCGKASPYTTQPDAMSSFATFRNIPGVTDEEIKAVEALRGQYGRFVYGVDYTTEAFPVYSGQGNEGGNYVVGGFAARFCEWLTGLFGIPFIPALYTDDWDNLLADFESGKVHFTGDLMSGGERRGTSLMTGTIAERTLTAFRIADKPSIAEIAKLRPPRLVFPRNFAPHDYVINTAEYTFESVFADNFAHAYRLLKDGEADAFVTMNTSEPVFDRYGNVVSETFFPLVFASVSLSTQNADLEPVISVVQKALESGGTSRLTRLHTQGRNDYIKNELFKRLTGGELDYIRGNPVVRVLAETDNYPISFYNKEEDEFQGIAFDIMGKLEQITGLSFEVANTRYRTFLSGTDLLESGEVSMITELGWSRGRAGRFLWPETPIMRDNSILISKSEFPNVEFYELGNVSVGMIRGTAHSMFFKTWFPNNTNYKEYDSSDSLFKALEHGEVDMMIARANHLLSIENYKEIAGYKTNVVFDNYFNCFFGFNKDEADLCAIVDKALTLIDLEDISGYWTRKTFDYRAKMTAARLPWLIGATALSLVVLALVLFMFFRSRNEGKRLAKLVAAVESANSAKSSFLAGVGREMYAPMDVIVGLTDLMLKEYESVDVKENLKEINNAGHTVMGLINDMLDISRIEAGKMELTPVQYEVVGLLNDVVTSNITRIGDKPVTFKLDVSENMPRSLFGDELRVRQILGNLLSNAFKYTKMGTVTLEIRNEKLEMRNEEAPATVFIIFAVSDTGIGIRRDDIPKLFSNFNQADTRINDGTGLGLSLIKKFVEMMDGEITVESEYGKGSTFRVRIRQGFVPDTPPIGKEIAEKLRRFRY